MDSYVLRAKHMFLDAEHPDVEAALVIENGRVKAFADETLSDLPVLDAGDAFVCPGFHDAHMHYFHAALFPSDLAIEYCGSSEADVVKKMQEFGESRPKDRWLVGHGWRETLWTDTKVPTKASLDAAFPDRPVALYSGDAHTLWLNSYGLNLLGITNETEPVAGGSFDRDENGEITGVLREAAGMYYAAKIFSSFTTDELSQIYADFAHKLNSLGITAICDMALSLIPGADGINAEVYEALLAKGQLTVRAHLFPTLSDDHSNLANLQQRLTGDMLQAPGFKQFFDGVSSQHTAWVSEPYSSEPHDLGKQTVAPKRMRDLVLQAAAEGYSTRIHTIGDAAVHEAIDIFTEAEQHYPKPQAGAYTIEHVEDISAGDLNLLAKSQVVASIQPPHIVIDVDQPLRDLGEARSSRMWPLDSFIEKNIPMAFGTDAPVVGPSSTDVLWTAIKRSKPEAPEKAFYPEHAISAVQAIQAYTEGSAKAVARENELGKLQPGYLADFAIWDTNLVKVSPEEILSAKVKACYVGGNCVYSVD